MLVFNNCKVGIFGDNSKISYSSTIHIKDAASCAIQLQGNSVLIGAGYSGGTGSSVKISSSVRGIQLDASRVELQNAEITDTRFAFLTSNASSFKLDKSIINGGVFGGSTNAAFGLYISDKSYGTFFDSTVSGYNGGTGSQTSGNFVVVKSSTVHVGATAQKDLANTVALGPALGGEVVVDPNKGNNILIGGTPLFTTPSFEE